ncbi:MAG: PSD1 and planctomycete cytochrome C domain-containing protein, partial [Verrucomicrobiales bacterium]
MRFFPLITIACSLGVSNVALAEVNYSADVKPILKEHCWKCHGPSQQKGTLRLDTAAAAIKGGSLGAAILPGKADKSILLQAVEGIHPELQRMPFKKEPLSATEIETLRSWINEGATAPMDEAPAEADPDDLHWSFKPITHPALPEVQHKEWVRNVIDYFILARLEKDNLKPSPEAAKATLLRRVFLDLTGLPPSASEVAQFQQETDPRAYEQWVEKLLASPHYGEKWGRHWLDQARYADSNGYSIDSPRSIWKYRDWVIDALNRDVPFDQFTIDQLAGDLLPDATLDQKIATGFHRNTMINEEGGIDKEQFRIESILDRVNTTGSVWLGLTVACSQCHDHKFDPISQKEYFELYAFFNNVDEPSLEVATEEEKQKRDKIRAEQKELNEKLKTFEKENAKGFDQWLGSGDATERTPEIRKVLNIANDKRTDKQKRALLEAYLNEQPGYQDLKKQLAALQKAEPRFPTTMVVSERKEPRESYIFIKGDFTRKGSVVLPGAPSVLPPLESEKPTRLDLAKWLVDARNPLTARVQANRLWMQYFGKGLVETENDFGTQGIPPTHPELLDWLASEFMKGDWSLKQLHRLIVTSATYRQSSHVRDDLQLVDANNKWLARQNRLRLDGEIIRDVALNAAGALSPEIGGPSVFPPQPDGVMTLGQSRREWKTSSGASKYRRGMYTFFWRATPHPSLMVFDAPDATSACTRRIRSNTPLQSLTLLNDEAFFDLARKLTDRVLASAAGSPVKMIDALFQAALSRSPRHAETQALQQYFGEELAAFAKNPAEAKALFPARSE